MPNGAENSEVPPQEVRKVALGPSETEADAHTFASLRSLQPRVLPFVLSFFRELPLLTASSGAAADHW